jgi:hypothetical protein
MSNVHREDVTAVNHDPVAQIEPKKPAPTVTTTRGVPQRLVVRDNSPAGPFQY